MSAFGNDSKDNLVFEIDCFLEDHSITELLEVVQYCIESIESKEDDYKRSFDDFKAEIVAWYKRPYSSLTDIQYDILMEMIDKYNPKK